MLCVCMAMGAMREGSGETDSKIRYRYGIDGPLALEGGVRQGPYGTCRSVMLDVLRASSAPCQHKNQCAMGPLTHGLKQG